MLDTSILTIGEKLSDNDEKLVKTILQKYDEADWLTLCSKLKYSSSFYSTKEQLIKSKIYYRRNLPIPSVDDYIKNIQIVHSDWNILYEQWKDIDYAFFIFDPPYESTTTLTYTFSSVNCKELIDCIAG